MRELRRVHTYQQGCLNLIGTDAMVHQRISDDVRQVHATMETCLTAILEMEGWDMATLTMPDNLKKQMVESDSDKR